MTGNSDSNQLFENENLKDKIAAIKLNLGESNSVSHSLSSSSQSPTNFKLVKDENQSKQEDLEMRSDVGVSVSSASLDNVPQCSIPRLQGLNTKGQNDQSNLSIYRMSQNSKQIFKSTDIALRQKSIYRNSCQTLKSYNKQYLDSIDNKSVNKDQNNISSSTRKSKKLFNNPDADKEVIG